MSKLEETRKAGRRTLIAIAIIGLSVYLGFTTFVFKNVDFT